MLLLKSFPLKDTLQRQQPPLTAFVLYNLILSPSKFQQNGTVTGTQWHARSFFFFFFFWGGGGGGGGNKSEWRR